ncbi:uncharacterized protein V1516DRAFT_693446 [Lipomyces oligophaga]|uniref:uncharacterized protein n=1 Tax=Lipomyces oligophaga TaxID=45792 RepID=UPI0034CE4744
MTKAVIDRNSMSEDRKSLSFNTLEREAYFRNPPKDKSAFPLLKEAVAPHIGSFNALTTDGLLDYAVKDIGEKTIFDSNETQKSGNKFTYRVDEVQILKPTLSGRDKTTVNRRVYPAESRERHTSYQARMILRLTYRVNDGPELSENRDVGYIPIMLRSNRCHLEKMSPAELIAHKEESEELGGYFIINGIEKLIRMLIVQRRNHPMAIIRPSFTSRGQSYSQYGIQIRCVRSDQTSQTNVLHYLTDGSITFRFSWRKNEYLIPVMMILKALVSTNDKEIFDGIVGSDIHNSFLTDRLELMLRAYKVFHLHTQDENLAFLGDKFRVVLGASRDKTDLQVGREFIRRVVLVHLSSPDDKFRLLLFMMRKLYALVGGDCSPDNPDAAQHQEVLLGGFLYGMIIKEKIEEYLNSFALQVQQDLNRNQPVNFADEKYLAKVFHRINDNIGKKLNYFLSTGNLVSQSGLDLQQVSGYTVVAEKINFYRFISHFRMVHRGSFFAQLKTTTVRKLLPESWGFLCPVHTPDGSPCGLLNHLAYKCRISTQLVDVSGIPALVRSLGVSAPNIVGSAGPDLCCVQLDGKVIGWCSHKNALRVADSLRFWKVEGTHGVPKDLEIGLVPPSNGGQYPGLFMFSMQARMLRPVKYLPLDQEDVLGPFEQVYMNIACTPDEIKSGVHTHVEFSPTNILSILANMTPFSDFNQSPRNMYQCQMSKQTMGTPGTALRYRADNKLYRLQTGQTPIVKAKLYDEFGLDNFPNGMNAVVAVISYTGYDMDDAMILNKSGHERGFGYGTVIKVEKFDLSEKRRRGEPVTQRFGFGTDTWPETWRDKLDSDGLPMIGVLLEQGDPVAAYFDENVGRTKILSYKSSEAAFVEEVRLLGDDNDNEFQSISVKLRITRSPLIGDKFSSRHGQKGVCSQRYPAVDMPFSESGIQPDIIINPHAFPSRMTIGMFVESLAGKAGAMHGIAQDSTPFQFNEQNTAADYFGKQLVESGYNYHGNEPMYSGITGEEFKADIYIGVVYYQRLRHMVNDKYQVRSTGPVNSLTMQPVKGRKRSGGIRVGEMERDALIAHGTSFLMQDRLLNCSDYTQTVICRDCGSQLSTVSTIPTVGSASEIRCRRCAKRVLGSKADFTGGAGCDYWEDGAGHKFQGGDNTTTVGIPYVLKYLDVELAAMGVQMKYNVDPK